jgi:hypothetical protein
MAVMKILVPVPEKAPRGRGLQGYHHKSGAKSVRFHFDDLALIEEEAEALNMLPSALIRWFTLHCVKQLHLVRTGTDKDISP